MAPVDASRRRPSSAPAERPDLVAQLGTEVAATLSSALERVQSLASTGRIDRAGLRALRDEIDRARRLGMMGQQVSRFAAGRVAMSPEPLDLTALLRETLLQRAREIERRGLQVRESFRPAVVIADSTLLFALLQSVLDWAFEHARSPIELKIERRSWPAQARLACQFVWLPADQVPTAPPPKLDTMTWHALSQTARTLGLPLQRDDGDGRTQLAIDFPRTVAEALERSLPLGGQGVHAVPLAGAHVLVVAAKREVRQAVRDTLLPRGVTLDFVTSVDEARDFCRGTTPHAVVHEAALGGEQFERLRAELLGEAPHTGFVQVTEDARAFELRAAGVYQAPSVGRDAIAGSLVPALLYALAR